MVLSLAVITVTVVDKAQHKCATHLLIKCCSCGDHVTSTLISALVVNSTGYHGGYGEWTVRTQTDYSELTDLYLRANAELQFPVSADLEGRQQEGEQDTTQPPFAV